jgi:gamma-glutamylcyclotransferase (GGCT)/AIG2-like uncharacterized protein YtfP
MQQHLVFVYGTLRDGEYNHWYLGESPMLGYYETPPEFSLYDLGPYPGLIEGHQSVMGEIYVVDDQTLSRLDELEDVPVEYRREQIETPFGMAWIYFYQDVSKLSQAIASGDWCQRI